MNTNFLNKLKTLIAEEEQESRNKVDFEHRLSQIESKIDTLTNLCTQILERVLPEKTFDPEALTPEPTIKSLFFANVSVVEEWVDATSSVDKPKDNIEELPEVKIIEKPVRVETEPTVEPEAPQKKVLISSGWWLSLQPDVNNQTMFVDIPGHTRRTFDFLDVNSPTINSFHVSNDKDRLIYENDEEVIMIKISEFRGFVDNKALVEEVNKQEAGEAIHPHLNLLKDIFSGKVSYFTSMKDFVFVGPDEAPVPLAYIYMKEEERSNQKKTVANSLALDDASDVSFSLKRPGSSKENPLHLDDASDQRVLVLPLEPQYTKEEGEGKWETRHCVNEAGVLCTTVAFIKTKSAPKKKAPLSMSRPLEINTDLVRNPRVDDGDFTSTNSFRVHGD